MIFSLDMLRSYISVFPQEEEGFDDLRNQLSLHENVQSRKNNKGHLTASSLVFNKSMDRVLLIHHKGLNRWLQPGGHLEEDKTLWEAAQREVAEETGVKNIERHRWHISNANIPFDIDTHTIPARIEKNEPEHLHHDCLFIAVASDDTETVAQIEEVYGAEWGWLDRLVADARLSKLRKKLLDQSILL